MPRTDEPARPPGFYKRLLFFRRLAVRDKRKRQRYVMQDALRSDTLKRLPITAGILAITEGIVLTSASDQECLERCLPVYEALYARLQAQVVMDQDAEISAQSVLKQTVGLAIAARTLRRQRLAFSERTFAQALKTRFRT